MSAPDLGAGPLEAPRGAIYRRALRYFAPDRRWIALLVGLIGVSVAVGLLEAWPLAVLIDTVLSKEPKSDWMHRAFLSLLPEDRLGRVIGLVLIGMGLQLVGYLAWMARMMISAHLNVWGTTRVRADMFARLQALGPAYHRAQPQGDAIYRLVVDASGPWGVVDVVIGTVTAAMTLTVMTAVMLSYNAGLTAAAFAVAPAMIWSNWVFARRIHARALAAKQADTDLTSLVQRALATIGLAQAFRREPHEFGRFEGAVGRSVRATLRLNWQEQLYPLVRDGTLAVAGALIFGYGGYLVYRDQFAQPVAGGMSVGLLFIFIDYTRKLWDPLKWLTEFVAKVQIYVASTRRVLHVIDQPLAVADRPDALPLPLAPRTLVLDRVGFSHEPGRPALAEVSGRIRPGEMVAFVGPSGAGKSTLLGLLLRFHDPDSGALTLDGLDYRQLRLADLRRHMALVTQDSVMLPVSVADNIAYGRPDATRDEVAAAAELAGAAEFIDALPQGYDTPLLDGGQNLSGGQRQRLAIARALLAEAPFLVLDEPSSALDPEQEARLARTLAALRGSRTVILVTHRLDAVRPCDQIFVMGAGRIVEHGTHERLLARRGLYARMWREAAPEETRARQPLRLL